MDKFIRYNIINYNLTSLRQILSLLFDSIIIAIVNLRYLGKPSSDTFEFTLSAYDKVFAEPMPFHYQLFYSLCGKEMIHIFREANIKAGFALFRVGPEKNIHIRSFGIINSFRGRGLAKPFLSESLSYWKARGFKTSSVCVSYANKIALRTYLSLGFQPEEFQKLQLYLVKQL